MQSHQTICKYTYRNRFCLFGFGKWERFPNQASKKLINNARDSHSGTIHLYTVLTMGLARALHQIDPGTIHRSMYEGRRRLPNGQFIKCRLSVYRIFLFARLGQPETAGNGGERALESARINHLPSLSFENVCVCVSFVISFKSSH